MTTHVDIEHWRPERLADFVGNAAFREYAEEFLYGIKQRGDTGGFNMIFRGDSRSGKTAGVTWLLQSLGCLNFDFKTLAPCGKCYNCNLKHHITGNRDWENSHMFIDPCESTSSICYNLLIVNGPELRAQKLDELLLYAERQTSGVKIIYIDEALRMDTRAMSCLLNPMDTSSAIWLATSATKNTSTRKSRGESEETIRIRKMFVNRFTFKIQTQLPAVDRLAHWLAERCREFGIQCQDPESTLKFLAERSRCIPGQALMVLNRAHKKRKPIVTRQLVEAYVFDLEI